MELYVKSARMNTNEALIGSSLKSEVALFGVLAMTSAEFTRLLEHEAPTQVLRKASHGKDALLDPQ